MLIEYIHAAMATARLTRKLDGTYHGDVPGFPGVSASAGTAAECKDALRKLLEGFILFRAANDLPLPVVGGHSLSTEEFAALLGTPRDRRRMEEEIAQLNETAGLDGRWLALRLRRAARGLRLERLCRALNADRAFRFCLTNWGFVLSVIGLAAILYAYVWYKVSYFENFANTSTVKLSADYYRELGDRMLWQEDFEEAERFYNDALKVNPNNIEATRGVLISQILQLPDGRQYRDPGPIHLKLQTLKAKFREPDHRLTYFEGYMHYYRHDYRRAEELFSESVRQAEEAGVRFAAGHAMTGFLNLRCELHDIDKACRSLQQAVLIDPDNYRSQFNLGYCYLLQDDFAAAAHHLQESYKISPRLSTAVNLGDAYLYLGRHEEAREKLDYARWVVTLPDVEKEFYISPSTTYHYVPEAAAPPAGRCTVEVSGLAQNRMFVDYLSAIDFALQPLAADAAGRGGRPDPAAAKYLEAALKADGAGLYKDFFAGKLEHHQAAARRRGVAPEVIAHLEDLKKRLKR